MFLLIPSPPLSSFPLHLSGDWYWVPHPVEVRKNAISHFCWSDTGLRGPLNGRLHTNVAGAEALFFFGWNSTLLYNVFDLQNLKCACVQAFAPAKKIGDFGKKVEVEFEDGTRNKVPQSECRSVIPREFS